MITLTGMMPNKTALRTFAGSLADMYKSFYLDKANQKGLEEYKAKRSYKKC